MSDDSIDYTVSGYGLYEYKTITVEEQRIADELHRRAQRIVDRVVAEAMENVRKTLKKP